MEEILHKAERLEKQYDWLGAAESYKKTLNLLPEDDFSIKGDVTERLGYAFYRAAFQAENNDEFRERMRQAVLSHEKAKEFYGRLDELVSAPKMFRCDAMIAYVGYWLTSEVPEKKRLLDECWQRTKEALDAFKETGNALEYGRTYNQLSTSAFLGYVLEWSFEAGEKIISEAKDYGEQAVALLSSVGDPYELAVAYVKAAFYLVTFSLYFVPDLDERGRHRQKGQDYLRRAKELCEEAALLALASTPGGTGDETSLTVNEMQMHFEKALDYAKKTKDKYLVGTALDWLTYATGWKSSQIDDPDKAFELRQRALQYAEDARHQFSSIAFVSPRGDLYWTEAPLAQYYMQAALFYETDPRKRLDLLEKAVTDAPRAIELAQSTGYPGIIGYIHQVFSTTLGGLAQMETSLEEKRRLLEKAVEHGTKGQEITNKLYPFHYWNRGIRLSFFANLKAETANFEKDFGNKKKMLEEVSSDKERGLQLCIKESLDFERRGDLSLFAALGLLQYFYGEFLNRLYGLTNSREHLRRAIRAFEEAAESYQKLDLVSRMAECCWKTARGYDTLGEHLTAAKNFNLASHNYKSAAERIPQLKDFYQNHASYMEAWNAIEKARHHHAEKQYGQAKEHYEKAADLHKSTTRWNYLSPNYMAWARLEEGEDLSRREQAEEAKDLFQQAVKLFAETKKSIQAKLEKAEDKDEKELLVNLADASDIREEYCLGRIDLEEAKILDKQGDHAASSRKYGSATEEFQKVSDAMKGESDRQEMKLIVYLCQAWQTMTRAEAEASPDLYKEASRLFEEAKDCSLDEKAKMLALGHSRFCKALEAGTRYEDSRDASLYILATQHLESAASYYLRAGFKSASEYAEATQKLLDAYSYMHKAKTATNPTEKAQFYMMTEKVLQASAGSYLKAKHPEKQEQVSSLLEKVKNEKELALSLTEVLHAPLATSSTATFTTPTPSEETPIGLERFDNADIQASLIIHQKELKVGELLHLEIELVNAGKGTALLIKVNEVVPEGFDLTEKPETCRVEDSYIDMKGKRLGPLKTEELRLVLKPKVQGAFVLKPTILYLDENGKYKSHEPESVTIVVKELGIKGWLTGKT